MIKLCNYTISATLVEEDSSGEITAKTQTGAIEVFSESAALELFSQIRREIAELNDQASISERSRTDV